MLTWFKIASRNLMKNARRSIITMSAVALGFAAVNLFEGFVSYMYHGNREAAIYTSYSGHLTITRNGFWQEGQIDPQKYYLAPEQIETIKKICSKIPEIILVTPQLNISGLVSNGRISSIFIAQGIVPSAIETFRNRSMWKGLVELERNELKDDITYGVAMAKGLARLLDLQVGSYAVAMSTTVHGQMNALDLEVLQLIDAIAQNQNDKMMRVPLSFAQSLYDTQGADRLVLLLSDTGKTELVQAQLLQRFSNHGLEFDITTWFERSVWYQKVKDMFDVIFVFLFTIVFVIVVMSIINTMSMAVLERTREIGTLRALGLKRKGVVLLFTLEAALMGIGGAVGGQLLTFLGYGVVEALKPTWTPPGFTSTLPLRLEFSPPLIILNFAILLLLCVLSSLAPAIHGARRNVVDALGHV